MKRLALLAALALAACTQPPTRELQAAESAVERARSEGAATFAAERLREAETALEEARAQVKARDYRRALSMANVAAERAQAARQGAQARRQQIRIEVQSAQAAVRGHLQSARESREAALAGKVPETALAGAEEQAKDVERRLGELDTLLAGDKLEEAAALATTLKTDAAALPTAVREAATAAAAKTKAKPKPKPTRRKR